MNTIRCAERNWAKKKSLIEADYCTSLEIYENYKLCNENSPLLSFSEELPKIWSYSSPKLNIQSVLDVLTQHRGNIFAPDHLLSGVPQNLLNVCFTILTNCTQSMRMGSLPCDSLAENGLICLRSNYTTTNCSLDTMKLSSIFCVLCLSLRI